MHGASLGVAGGGDRSGSPPLDISLIHALALTPGPGCIAFIDFIYRSAMQVIETAASVLPIVAACLPGDGLNSVMGGVLRGSGRQGVGAALNFATYWCLGLPLVWLLAFKAGLGIAGLWAGIAATTTLQVHGRGRAARVWLGVREVAPGKRLERSIAWFAYACCSCVCPVRALVSFVHFPQASKECKKQFCIIVPSAGRCCNSRRAAAEKGLRAEQLERRTVIGRDRDHIYKVFCTSEFFKEQEGTGIKQ